MCSKELWNHWNRNQKLWVKVMQKNLTRKLSCITESHDKVIIASLYWTGHRHDKRTAKSLPVIHLEKKKKRVGCRCYIWPQIIIKGRGCWTWEQRWDSWWDGDTCKGEANLEQFTRAKAGNYCNSLVCEGEHSAQMCNWVTGCQLGHLRSLGVYL